MDGERHQQQREVELPQRRLVHRAHAGQGHAGQEVNGIPEAVAAEQPPEEGGQRHHQPADEAALEARRGGVNGQRQA